MQRDPLVCVEDALMACLLIQEFTSSINYDSFSDDSRTKAAVERQFEIIGEALNRIKQIDETILAGISNWRQIIGFRNVIAHGYDVIEDKVVWDAVINDIPVLTGQLQGILKEI
ncbi:MAG: hypothetical protein CVV44_10455 [Spirochaetae bacterium HGW-Spirochaetae-1]|jgi:uncharacterized protein with HEPN domain|nr:MAG: hypothetical protein CVV44_10455 [Spirochaetae bacterium HGW-Spirochaetae-1]